jgi:ABC-2 type transport system permease protein
VVTNNKFIGYLLMILLMVSQVVMGVMHLDHNLYNIGGLPRTPYSDMNGYGHFITGWAWFALYWTLFTVGGADRGPGVLGARPVGDWRSRVREAGRRLKGLPAWRWRCAASPLPAWAAGSSTTRIPWRATKPRTWRWTSARCTKKPIASTRTCRTPKITDVRAAVDIYPEERRVTIKGSYVLENKTSQPLDTLRLQFNPDVETTLSGLPAHKVELDDKKFGVRIIKLAQALPPGGRLPLDFTVDVRRPGFRITARPTRST